MGAFPLGQDLLIGAGTWFALLALQKAVLEPIAERTGQAVVERFIGPFTAALDLVVTRNGLDCDFEAIVRDWLIDDPTPLSSTQIDLIVDEVFKVWDLRVASRKAQGQTFRF